VPDGKDSAEVGKKVSWAKKTDLMGKIGKDLNGAKKKTGCKLKHEEKGGKRGGTR